MDCVNSFLLVFVNGCTGVVVNGCCLILSDSEVDFKILLKVLKKDDVVADVNLRYVV